MIRITAYCFLMLTISALYAFSPADPTVEERNWPSIFDALSSGDEVLEVTLTVDLDDLSTNRNVDEYREGVFEWGNGVENALPVRVKPRGKYRRKVCDFPPLKLQFPKKELRARKLNKHNDLKLVTHCVDARSSKATILREYLAYELYQELTEDAFRVQLVKITYRDVENPRRTLKRFGILIEDTDEMAERLGGKTVKKINAPATEVAGTSEELMTVFQMLIGNHDYDLVKQRNFKWVEGRKEGLVPVPYDFDFSGLVNASYAITNPDHHELIRITDRKYLGRTADLAELDTTVQYVLSKKEALLQRVKDCKVMSPAERSACTHYLKDFFKRVDPQELLAGEVMPYEIMRG